MAYPNGPSGSPNIANRNIILNDYEQLGLKPDRMDDLLKRNAKNVNNSTITSDLIDTLKKGVSQGWESPGLLKAIFNWKTFVPNTNSKGWQLFVRWLFTGTTRSTSKGVKEIFNVLVQNGVSKEFAKILAVKLVSVGTEVFKRWLILNGSIFLLNLTISYFMEAGTEEERERREAELDNLAIKDLEDLWGKIDMDWVWPISTVGPAIFTTVKGILKRETPSEIYKQLRSNNLPEQKEKEKLDNEIKNDKDDSKLEDFIDDSKSFIGEKGLQLFLKSKGKEYEPNSFKPTNFIRSFLKYFVLFFKNKKVNNEQYSVAKKTF
jgi:hypothetical protein